MANTEQIEANRRNSQRSTGPKSAGGKAAASRNSLKHGLLSGQVLLPTEKAKDLAELSERLRAELKPVGELEALLVDRMVGLLWRLRRLAKFETGILAWHHCAVLANRARDSASDRWLQLRHGLEGGSELPTWGEVFVRDSGRDNALSKLSRYETTVERGFYKALHELERLQAAKQGKDVPVPVAVDIDVSGMQAPVPETVEEW